MKEGWKEYKLDNIGSFKNGANFSSDKMGRGKALVNVKDITDSPLLHPERMDLVDFDVSSKSGAAYLAKVGDIFFVRSSVKRDGVGAVGMLKNNETPVIHCGFVIRFRLESKDILPRFAFYLFNTSFNREKIRNISGGATIVNISQGSLKMLKFKFPPLPTQRKIATILSAYDDLIENNLKRIKLLEEKAQLTYEEWFVRLKFPGHETTPINEETGLPEGWEKKTFSSAVNVNPKTTIKKGVVAPFVPMGSISERSMIIEPVEERAVSGGMKFKNGDTLFARITPCLENGKTGFVQFMKNENEVATGSTEYIVLRETEDCGKYFIYCTSRVQEFRENAIKSMAGSDGRQRVKSDCFNKYDINFAPFSIRLMFENLADPIFRSIQNLVIQNQRLKEARDILLPRLMMGMIDTDKITGVVMEEQKTEDNLSMAAEPKAEYK